MDGGGEGMTLKNVLKTWETEDKKVPVNAKVIINMRLPIHLGCEVLFSALICDFQSFKCLSLRKSVTLI